MKQDKLETHGEKTDENYARVKYNRRCLCTTGRQGSLIWGFPTQLL